VIINGWIEGTGLDANELAGLMRNAERGDGGPSVDFTVGAVAVGAAAWRGDGADVWLVRYDPRVIEVVIKRGADCGRGARARGGEAITTPRRGDRVDFPLGRLRDRAFSAPRPTVDSTNSDFERVCRLLALSMATGIAVD
jgi:hypothetical protein